MLARRLRGAALGWFAHSGTRPARHRVGARPDADDSPGPLGFLAPTKAPPDAYLRACGIEESGRWRRPSRSELRHAKASALSPSRRWRRDYARLSVLRSWSSLFVPSEAALSAALRDALRSDDAMARAGWPRGPVNTLLAVARTCDGGAHEHQRASDQIIALGRDFCTSGSASSRDTWRTWALSAAWTANKAVSSME